MTDNSGNIVIPIDYKSLAVNNNKVIVAKKQNNKSVLIDFKNNQLSAEYDYIDEFSADGMYEVYNRTDLKRQKGYITETGEPAIPLKYWTTQRFEDGLAVVENYNYETEVINKNGKVLYRAKKYRDVFNLGNGYILAENKNNEFEIIRLL